MKAPSSIAIVVGTRPELIKMAPVVHALHKAKIKLLFIHTGQHYSYELDSIFLRELELPVPDTNLHVGSGTPGLVVSKMIEGISNILIQKKPTALLVQGDTNSALAGALAGGMEGIPVAHVEAGLRSYDRTMPEETNRIAIDHIADVLFAPTNTSRDNLLHEGITRGKIHVVGNTVVDSVKLYLPKVSTQKKTIVRYNLAEKEYSILTLHRPGTVDDPIRLQAVLLSLAKHSTSKKILFPVHPRTRKQITQNKIIVPSFIEIIEPIGYFDMLSLICSAEIIFTDSGGLQEEASILGVPCVTLRPNTERPETLTYNQNVLVTDLRQLPKAIYSAKKAKKHAHPFGKGDTGKRIVTILRRKYG